MAIRDEKYNWKKESLELESDVIKSLTPILEKALALGFTMEDFFYITTFGMTEISIDYAFKKKG